jgi:glucuronoarabinoxylan endo-1,4-beta-xylanase
MRVLAGASAWAAFVFALSTPAVASAADVVVSPNELQQRIDGFGASSAWENGYNDANDPVTLFSTTKGAGLSLFRVRIDPYNPGTTTPAEIAMAKTAQGMGVGVWATPWTPPGADKTGCSEDGGCVVEGTLSNPSAWASTLASYVTYMKNNGINLLAVSSQNEPDANVTYESCVYTGASLASFVGSYMGPALAASGVKVMSPETQNWESFPAFESALEANSAAWGHTAIVATHEYGGTPSAYPSIQAAGKEFWETEWADPATVDDPSIAEGLVVAGEIYQALTVANMNAWHYWWFYGGENQGLWSNAAGTWAKRLWVMGNFARFVRPGFYRVTATPFPATSVFVSAFYDTASKQLVVVAINQNQGGSAGAGSVPLSFLFNGASTGSWTSWVTSATKNLEPGDPVPLDKGVVTYTLEPQSVTTLWGTVTGPGSPIDAAAYASDNPGADGGANTGAGDAPVGGEGCGLACESAGRISKRRGGSLQSAIVGSLLGCVLWRRRARRRRRSSVLATS